MSAHFKEGVEDMSDLASGMILEGVVTNVTAFGAFVDVGVHQDGLVHISAMSEKFVSDPHRIVRTGQIVKVRVLEVDAKRKRISLSMIFNPEQAPQDGMPEKETGHFRKSSGKSRKQTAFSGNAMSEAFAKLKGSI